MPTNSNFVFFGSFHISAEILEHTIAGGCMPSLVVCSPDRLAGRKQAVTAPAVKQLILEKRWPIKILQPEKPTDIIPQLVALQADFFVVMGYPHILPEVIVNMPRLGTIGVHPSLLPKYRGASPMQSVLLAGEKTTGVTLYAMDAKMDHGPILATCEFEIEPEATNIWLGHKAATEAGRLLAQTIPFFVTGQIKPRLQDHAQATFTKKFTTADGQVDMTDATDNGQLTTYRKIKAFNPEPGVWTMNYPSRVGIRVKLLAATWHDGRLRVREIQPDGKKPFTV